MRGCNRRSDACTRSRPDAHNPRAASADSLAAQSGSKRRHIPAGYGRDGRHGSRGAGPNFNRLSYIVVSMSTAEQLGSLNAPQRKAVTYGEPLPGGKGFRAGPLLIVAGAGTGKTNTLAHRVAHLAMSGVDPARILMLTFTRRASIEMKRRANEIMREAFDDKLGGGKASAISQRLTWAGTFHSIGNRLLRHYAKHVGLDPAFTVLDRSDSADLVDTVRTELGYSGKGQRFPRKDTCPRDLFLPREYPEVAQGNARHPVRVVYALRRGHRQAAARLRRAQVAVQGARFRRPAAVLARDDERRPHRQVGVGAFRSRAGRRIPGHQQAAGRHPHRAEARRPGRHRRRRRRAGYLLVPRRRGREHPRFPRPLPAQGGGGDARAELPFQPEHSRFGQRAHGGCAAAVPQAPAVDARPGSAPQARDGRRSAHAGGIHLHARARLARGRNSPAGARPCCSAPARTATCSRSSSRSARFLS